MWNLNYSSINEISSVLAENGLAMTKKFGQNFLINPDARERIAASIQIEKGMRVWEIGPGLGAITHILLKKGASVTAFEIDHGFASVLRNKAFSDEDFTLIEGDALETLFQIPFDAERIVGNLPYNVGSEIIARIIERGLLPPLMVFTLQKEVAERMTANAGSYAYSSFSVLSQLEYDNSIPYVIRAGSFFPAPRVDSAVIVMKRRESSILLDGEREGFLAFVRMVFNQRRKTLRNNILSSPLALKGREEIDKAFSSVSLTGGERAETLDAEKLISLYRAIK